jgi:alpha-glucosidase
MVRQTLNGASLSFITMPSSFTALVLWAGVAYLTTAQNVTKCPGYRASNVKTTDGGLTADLTLAGDACNAYGKDLHDLKFLVEYQTGT